MSCDLCNLDGFIITICNTCNIPMVILREHRAEFNAEEMVRIGLIFRGKKIRWEMRQIKNHAHCHIKEV